MTQERFLMNADSFEDADHYFINRSKQLKRYGIEFYNFRDIEIGTVVDISYIKDGVITSCMSLYLYNSYRNKGLYKETVDMIGLPVLTIDDCNITQYLTKNNINHIVAPNPYESVAYRCISDFYGNGKAERSQVYFMNHIDEGLYILEQIGADQDTKDAYCLHPIIQSDEALTKNIGLKELNYVNSKTLLLSMEYRNIANKYLSKRHISSINEIELSILSEVNKMLVADKIQNRKDFELFHLDKHKRSNDLKLYFDNWLKRLDVSEETYQKFKNDLIKL